MNDQNQYQVENKSNDPACMAQHANGPNRFGSFVHLTMQAGRFEVSIMKSLIFATCLMCLIFSGCSETSARRQARIRKECPTYQEVLVIKNAGSGRSYTYLAGRVKVL